ncbi:hypothetical protein HDU79_008988 [Rhizoclosmatium sp. JEL0117]|nr:hypothetical protein HDU79_008988 [Rhizoclosmatium sp. JEL0117]
MAASKTSGLTYGNKVTDGLIDTRISQKNPIANVVAYKALGLAVSNVEAAAEFYSRFGFDLEKEKSVDNVNVLTHPGGLELHVFKRIHIDNKNILMDYDENKYPGINHMSYSVPNVTACKGFLESKGITIKDKRQYPNDPRIYAIFIRDPDMTTIEFENNHGEEFLSVEHFTASMIGENRPIDHVGIRVFDPDSTLTWYAEKLGFNNLVAKFEYDPTVPLKNGRPWISRTQSGTDINLILNTNERPKEHVLTAGGSVAPGILYAFWSIEESISVVAVNLKAEGVPVVLERDVETSELKFLSKRFVPAAKGLSSIFIQDPCQNIIRLIGPQ